MVCQERAWARFLVTRTSQQHRYMPRWQAPNLTMTYQSLKVESRGICLQWEGWHEKDCNHRGRKWNDFHSVQLWELVDEWEWVGGYALCHSPEAQSRERAIYKEGMLLMSEVQQRKETSKDIWQTMYGFPMIVAICFRLVSYGAAQLRDAIFKRLYGAKEKTAIILQLYGGTNDFS